MEPLIKVFKALSEPVRVKIIKLLEKKSMCVCELKEILKITQPNVSHHLKILKDAGLIIDQKDGLWVNYELNNKSEYPFNKDILKLISKYLNDDKNISDCIKRVGSINRNDICCKK